MNTELNYWLEKLRHERWTLHGGPGLSQPEWLRPRTTPGRTAPTW